MQTDEDSSDSLSDQFEASPPLTPLLAASHEDKCLVMDLI